MNIYAKLMAARLAFHSLDLKKSGHNKFAGYNYFELSDFLITGMKCLADQGLLPLVTFEADRAVLTVYETDGEGQLQICSPSAKAELKGCHPIQNLGAEEKYQRRYLWMALLEIVEHDAIDAAEPKDEYSTEQEAEYDRLLEANEPFPFFAYLRSLPEPVRISLHNKWPAGSKVSMKRKAGELETKGGALVGDYADGIIQAVDSNDYTGLKQLLDELDTKPKKTAVWSALKKETRDAIGVLLSENES